MNITSDHWLEGVKRVKYPAGPEMAVRRFGVAHFTSGATAMSSIDFWRTPAAKGAEAHVVIDRDGTIYQVRAFNQQADHAGASTWVDPNTRRRYDFLNRCSIGIEFANAGDDPALAKRWSKLPLIKARHKNGGPVCDWEAFPEAQILAGIQVFQAITKRYHLDDLVGHDDIAPARKSDPGPAFPMQRVREACGFTGMPKR
ncbi:MAG: N-acetylmuramoyl-L-alanine amidase [Luteolibacter sp.]